MLGALLERACYEEGSGLFLRLRLALVVSYTITYTTYYRNSRNAFPEKNLQKAQDNLRTIRKEQSDLLRIFYRNEELVAGSYSEVFIRCGQPTCRCHQEGGHFATRLSQWVAGKLKSKIVRVADRERVKIASDHYKAHKSTLRDLRNLHSEELKLLKRIVELRTRKYE